METQKIKRILVSTFVIFFFFGAQMTFAFSGIPAYPKILTKSDYQKKRKSFKLSRKIKTGMAKALDKAEKAYDDANWGNYAVPEDYKLEANVRTKGIKKVKSFQKKFKKSFDQRYNRMWKANGEVTDLAEETMKDWKTNKKVSQEMKDHMKKIWLKSDQFDTKCRKKLRKEFEKENKHFTRAIKFLENES